MSGNYPALDEKSLPRVIQSIQDLFSGRNNAYGEFTLAVAPATSTVVTAPNCGEQSTPLWTPMNSNAAVEYAAGTMWCSLVEQGSFTVNHSSSANVRTFRFAFSG